MKITKSQLKQIIKEEVDASEELIDAIERLTKKINPSCLKLMESYWNKSKQNTSV